MSEVLEENVSHHEQYPIGVRRNNQALIWSALRHHAPSGKGRELPSSFLWRAVATRLLRRSASALATLRPKSVMR
jgi:hypothetical protein